MASTSASVAEEIRIDRGRRCAGSALCSQTLPRLFGTQQADMAREAGAPARLAAVVVHHRHAEMQLDVGHVEVGAGFEEAAAFGDVRRHRPAPLAPVLRDALEDSRDAAERQAGEVRRIRGEAEDEIRMILQVLSDAGQMVRGGDAVPGQRGRVADARQHQKLRRLERAGGDDHFAPGANLLQSPCPGGIRRRPRACPRTGCGWPARWSRRANWLRLAMKG